MTESKSQSQIPNANRTSQDPLDLLDGGLKILCYPNPTLKKKSTPVEIFDQELADFVRRLFTAMRINKGVGLAAPQVGVLKRIAVIEHEGKSYTLINPKIIERKGLQESEEGCLSFPGFYADVRRAEKIKVETRTLKGDTEILEVDGYIAKAFQHEIDHLDGKLFIDYLSPLKRSMIRKKISKHPGGNS